MLGLPEHAPVDTTRLKHAPSSAISEIVVSLWTDALINAWNTWT